MMKRKDLLKSAFTPEPSSSSPGTGPSDRVPSGAVRAMGLSLGRLSNDAARLEALEEQLQRGDTIQDLDPKVVEPSFVEDRLARTSDPEFRRLVDSISNTGQQVPILVRPHPDRAGSYQVAYGHRRLSACAELGKAVKAIVRSLSDDDLVIAQGKENAERRNLSFIERATFATHLERRGFDRQTIQSALAVHPAELTRLLAVSRSIPSEFIQAIGPSPRAGRPRWIELSKLLERSDRKAMMDVLIAQPSFQRVSSDMRFDLALKKLREASTVIEAEPLVIRNSSGRVVIRTERTSTTLRLVIDRRTDPDLEEHLFRLLPGIIQDLGGHEDQ